jgi:hypothetical protein
MITLLLLYALNVVNPSEMACAGSIQSMTLPLNVYIAGVEMEGTATLATQGQVLYLNGPNVSSLKAGTIQRVVRPEGRVHDPLTGNELGFYYKDIGTIQIETVEQDKATARARLSCQGMIKGDVVIPDVPRSSVQFSGSLSSDLTVLPGHELVGSILFGKDDAKELSAGNFCFLDLGGRDGIKVGDRLTIFRPYPAFDSKDMALAEMGGHATYSGMNRVYRTQVDAVLQKRKLPPQILGDVIVVDVKEGVSVGKVINSLSEIHVGDLVVKR